mgnify:CR=1 FL=1|tara:strand:+ start:1607 stop:2257 length:651 start_codon:yes stop_codon:yes gene_type:complete
MAYNYKRLTLTSNPLADPNFDLSKFMESRAPVHPSRSYNMIDNIDELLSPELLAQLEEINLKSSFAIVFAGSQTTSTDDESLIHYDLTTHNGEWVSVPFAINWELNSSIYSTVKWYDTSGLVGTPLVETPKTHHLNVFHYGYVGKSGRAVPEIIDQVIVDSESDRSPVLFNTSQAHTVSYSTPEPLRAVLSLRFSIDDISTWDDAVTKFQKFIRED